MKNISEIIRQFVNRDDHEPRVVGRYYSSEVFSIMRGYVGVKDFFQKRQIDLMGSKYISEGMAIEDYLTKVFSKLKIPVECQTKKETKITDEITLVVKPDYEFKDFVAELKRPKTINPQIPEKWAYQLECEFRACNKPVKLWQVEYPITIYEIDYVPSPKRWADIQKALKVFHQRLKEHNADRSIHKKGSDRGN